MSGYTEHSTQNKTKFEFSHHQVFSVARQTTPNQNQMVQKHHLSYQHVVLKSGLTKKYKALFGSTFGYAYKPFNLNQ